MFDPSYPAFPIAAFLGACLVLIPLPWHLQAWNSGTCLYMAWTAIACLNLGINSVVWSDNAINSAPVWCDISSRIIVAVAVAIPAASLCINRRLYYIATIKTVSVSKAEKRRSIFIDLAIGVGIPLLQILFQYIVSGHRFDIFENVGCYPYTYNTPLAYPFSIVWPVVIGLISAVYCILTLRAFFRRRAQFNEYLASNKGLTANRYFRLMALASIELLCTIPIASYGIYLNVSAAPIHPWISWSDTHWHYFQVDQYPAIEWRADRTNVISLELSQWLVPFCAFVFFAFFGFAEEARKQYSKVWQLIKTFCMVRLRNETLWEKSDPRMQSAGILPTFISRPPRFHRHPSLAPTTSSVDLKSDATLFETPATNEFALDISKSFTPSSSCHDLPPSP